MVDKSIGAHVGGPEDRIVSASMGIGYPKLLTLPNPIPYRGIFIGLVQGPQVSPRITPNPVLPWEYSSASAGDVGEIWCINRPVSASASAPGDTYRTGTYSDYIAQITSISPFSSVMVCDPRLIQAKIDEENDRRLGVAQAAADAHNALPDNATYTYVMASDGQVLAQEVQVTTEELVQGSLQNVTRYDAIIEPWSGGGYADMYEPLNGVFGTPSYHHKLTFSVPEDCIYPITTHPPTYPGTETSQITSLIPAPILQPVVGVATYLTSVRIWWVGGGNVTIDGSYTVQFFRSADSSYTVVVRSATRAFLGGYLVDGTYAEYFASGALPELPVFGGVADSRVISPAYFSQEYLAFTGAPADVTRYRADWAAGQAALKPRRKNWFKKNHDTVLALLITGTYILPSLWTYRLKRGGITSTNTYRPILVSATYVDALVSDTSANNTQEGTSIKRRTTTFTYTLPVVQLDGSTEDVTRTMEVIGTVTGVSTRHVGTNTGVSIFTSLTYADWYVPNAAGYTTDVQLLTDSHTIGVGQLNSLGQLLNGTQTGGWNQGGTYPNPPTNPLLYVVLDPPVQVDYSTLVGTAPEYILTYRKDVPIKYAVGAGDIAWNDSALQDGQTVSLIFFGPKDKGMFGEWEDTDTMIQVYGEATFRYFEGRFIQTRWKPPKTPNMTETIDDIVRVSRTCPRPVPYTETTSNSLVTYNSIRWNDVRQSAAAVNTALKAETPLTSLHLAVKDAMTYVPTDTP